MFSRAKRRLDALWWAQLNICPFFDWEAFSFWFQLETIGIEICLPSRLFSSSDIQVYEPDQLSKRLQFMVCLLGLTVFLSLLACLEFTVAVPYSLKLFVTNTLLMLIILTITESVSQRAT